MTVPWLTILWALPILGAVVILALPAAQRQFAKYAALAVSLAVLAVAVVLAVGFDEALVGLGAADLHALLNPPQGAGEKELTAIVEGALGAYAAKKAATDNELEGRE